MGGRLKGLDAYVAALPRGMDSHPEALVKGSALRMVMSHPAVASIAKIEGVPHEVVQLIEVPPIATSWHPEVAFGALTTALYEVAFEGAGGPPAFEAWACEANARMFSSALYKVLFTFLSPERLLTSLSSRWAAFHRGSALTLVRSRDQAVQLRLTHPAHLFSVASLQAFTGAFRAAVLAAGGEVEGVGWLTESPTSTRWNLEWRSR